MVVDTANGVVFGALSPSVLADETFFRWHFLELAFFMLLEGQGLMGVHASALVKDDRAILLRARSGGGKTTLAYAGARDRFQALAEDVVWLDGQRQRWWGRPWSFHLLPDARQLFPELVGYEPVLQTNGEMKLEVNLEDIRPNSTTTSAQPSALVLIDRQPGGDSRLESIGSAAVRAAWSAGQTGLEMQLPHHACHFDNLLTLPAYRLDFGDDIDHALALLEAIF